MSLVKMDNLKALLVSQYQLLMRLRIIMCLLYFLGTVTNVCLICVVLLLLNTSFSTISMSNLFIGAFTNLWCKILRYFVFVIETRLGCLAGSVHRLHETVAAAWSLVRPLVMDIFHYLEMKIFIIF